ncbi:hypothetical protein CBR_g48447 [Chara braunii]|uniref:DUF659 domain-containing protein n=1 Tax=Chara braunii TaxID=69332 RepID=A0A388M2V3_CHABU|nr:hypothetical protein CBR_g48447 [Chara braunii]|eukprot:GBG88835.1 hypothetical protein CBR_g48447 [Chara braunii]
MNDSFDPIWQQDLDAYFLQWFYVSGIPFRATKRPEFNTFRKHLDTCPPRVHPFVPNNHHIFGDGIVQQHKGVADMLMTLERDMAATGATILTDGRKSITGEIVNFLADGSSGAYLLRTVLRDGAEQDTASVVVRQWKKIFDDFGVENVNAIYTDSAGRYVAAAKLLAHDKDLQYSQITWLPCAVHVCNLMLSDIGKYGRDGVVGHRDDTIIRARAVVRFIWSHGAALTLFRRFFAYHPPKGQTALLSASSGTSGRGRELIYPVRGVGYVLPWEDEDVVMQEERPKPRDSGVRPADKVSDEQLDRQASYYSLEEVVYDPKHDPLAQDEIEEEPWSDPKDLDVEWGRSSDDDFPLAQMRRETRESTSVRPHLSPRPRDTAAPAPAVVDRAGHAEAQRQGPSIRQRQRTSIDSGSDDDDRVYEGSSESDNDMDFGSGADDATLGGDDGPRDITPAGQQGQRRSARLEEERDHGAGGAARGGGDGSGGQTPLSTQRGRSEAAHGLTVTAGDLAAATGSLTDFQGMSMGPPPISLDVGQAPVAAGETPISQVGMEGTSRQAMRSTEDVVDCSPMQEMDVETNVDRRDREERLRALALAQSCPMTQDIRATLDAARALETGVELVAVADRRDTYGMGEWTHDPEEVQEGATPNPCRVMAEFADRDLTPFVVRITMRREVVMGLLVEGMHLMEDWMQLLGMRGGGGGMDQMQLLRKTYVRPYAP